MRALHCPTPTRLEIEFYACPGSDRVQQFPDLAVGNANDQLIEVHLEPRGEQHQLKAGAVSSDRRSELQKELLRLNSERTELLFMAGRDQAVT